MPFDNKSECGIGPLTTGLDDAFAVICDIHDQSFVLHEQGQETLTRKEVDARFLRAMLIRAGDSTSLKARAYLYYSIARVFGNPFWSWGILD